MREYRFLLLSIALAVAFFLGDLFVSLDVAGGVLYVVAVLVTMWTPKRRLTDLVALLSTVFLFVGYMVGPTTGDPWVDVVNRILGLLAVWLTAALVAERRRVEDQLRQSEVKTRSILNATTDAIVSLDPAGRIETFNPAAGRIFGFPDDEIAGRPISALTDPASTQDLNDYLRAARRRLVNGDGLEIVGRRKDGSTFPMHVTFNRLDVEGREQVTGVLRDLTHQRQLEQEMMRVSELERRRIGHQLHEGLGQMLTGIGLITRSLCQKLRTERSPYADEAGQIIEFLHEADEYARDLSLGLVPLHQDETGLSYALQRLAANDSERYGIEISYRHGGRPVTLEDPIVAAHLYQIVQEAITEIATLAQPSRISILLAGTLSQARLVIEDDGIEALPTNGARDHLPWESVLSYRARLIGASLKTTRGRDGGSISCTLPLRSREDSPLAGQRGVACAS